MLLVLTLSLVLVLHQLLPASWLSGLPSSCFSSRPSLLPPSSYVLAPPQPFLQLLPRLSFSFLPPVWLLNILIFAAFGVPS